MYVNNFYSIEDFLGVLKEIRDRRDSYNDRKFNIDISIVQDYMKDFAILSSQLADIGGDLYAERLSAETRYRNQLLLTQERLENEYRKPNSINPASGKKWTNVEDRARYSAELECFELRKEMDEAKATHIRAYNLYALTLPRVIEEMKSRVIVLGRERQIEANEGQKPEVGKQPRRQLEEDGFHLWDLDRMPSQSMDDLDKELEEFKEEII